MAHASAIYKKNPISLEVVPLALLRDLEDDLGDLARLVLRQADLLAELVVPADDLPLLLRAPVLLGGLLLGLGQLVGYLHAGGYEVDDLLVYGLDLLPQLVGVRHRCTC
jgi:hypothetical protein